MRGRSLNQRRQMHKTISHETQSSAFPHVPSDAQTRTFRFCADDRVVGKLLLNIIAPLLQASWTQPGGLEGSRRHVQFTLSDEGLTVANLRWFFKQLANSDHAVATLARASDFEFEAAAPCASDLQATMPSLAIVGRLAVNACTIGRSHMEVASSSLLSADRMQRAAARAAREADAPCPDMFGALTLDGRTIADQDVHYLRHRRPYVTKLGTEERTFRCRAEFEKDVKSLFGIIHWAIESAWSSQEGRLDTELKFTLKPKTLSIDDVRWLFGRIEDCHVPVETLALESEYTGERSWLDAEEMGATQPGDEAIRQCAGCLADGRGALTWQLRKLDETIAALQ